MKLNNKGFIATAVLYGITAILIVTIAIILSNSLASRKNTVSSTDKLKIDIIEGNYNKPYEALLTEYDPTTTCTGGRVLDASGNCVMHYNDSSQCGCKEYNSCQNSSCGVESYKSCPNEACGVETYKSCPNKDACGEIVTACTKYGTPTCQLNFYGSNAQCKSELPKNTVLYEYSCGGNTGRDKCISSCIGKVYSPKSCPNEACGVETYKICQTSACGVASYKSCVNNSCSCKVADSCDKIENAYRTTTCNDDDKLEDNKCKKYSCPDGGELNIETKMCEFN